ncbi:hypothetical protein K0U27_10565 [archaeon]|nr:hypothetical protein [archaeon]
MTEKNKDSIAFRIHPADEDDQCKSVVRIGKKHMQQLDIKEGEVIKLEGNTKSTVATCLALDETKNYVTNNNTRIYDIEIECKSKDGLSERKDPYPKIRINHLIDSQLGSRGGQTGWVMISKFDDDSNISSLNDKESSAAETITLGTLDMFEKIMPGYRDQIDWNDAKDLLIQKDDKISISFKEGAFAEQRKLDQQQQEQFRQQRGQSSETGSKRPPRPPAPLPRCFSSIVLDVKPEERSFWNIDKETKFEFQDVEPDVLEPGFKLKPRNLSKVMPIAKQVHVDGINVTIASLEIYENIMKLIFYSEQRIKIPESDFTNVEKVNGITSMLNEPRFVIALSDDLENSYHAVFENGGTRHTGPDLSTKEAVSEQEWYSFLQPLLDPKASELTISINEMHWFKRNQEGIDEVRFGMRSSGLPSDARIPQEHHPPGKLVIIEGPWEFRIPIE